VPNLHNINHGLICDSLSEFIGNIDSLITNSQSRYRICSIIFAEIQESFIRNDDRREDESLSGKTELQLTVGDRGAPKKIEILAVGENQTRLGELLLSMDDPGTPLLPPILPHEVDSERLLSHPHWNPENASGSPELARLWVGAHVAAWLAKCNV
jgi:hypothetical protein